VALPTEHGGWGLLGEPILLGLILAPSTAGVAVASACLCAFLLHHPLKLVLADRRRGTRYPRTAVAERFAAGYAGGAVLSLAIAFNTAGSRWLVPLALAAPVAALQLWFDARNQGRQLAPQLAGAVALSGVATAVVLAGGGSVAAAWTAWLLLGAKALGSIVYVRARLRRARGLPASAVPALALHAGTIVVAVLVVVGPAAWTAVVAFALLLTRAAMGLRQGARAVRPQTVGFQELAVGIASTLLIAAGLSLAS
jgi:hypothetical protein